MARLPEAATAAVPIGAVLGAIRPRSSIMWGCAPDREVRGEPFFTIDKPGYRLGVYL